MKVYDWRGTLTLPDALSGPFKALVLAHGYSNYRDEIGGFPPLTAALASAKIAAFRFDCRLWRERRT